jgi:hypothetical protein
MDNAGVVSYFILANLLVIQLLLILELSPTSVLRRWSRPRIERSLNLPPPIFSFIAQS